MDLGNLGDSGMAGGGGDQGPQKPDLNGIIAQLQDALSQLQAYAQEENGEPNEPGDMGGDDSLGPLGGKAMPSMRKGPLYGS